MCHNSMLMFNVKYKYIFFYLVRIGQLVIWFSIKKNKKFNPI